MAKVNAYLEQSTLIYTHTHTILTPSKIFAESLKLDNNKKQRKLKQKPHKDFI